jgi:hypothetical protein
MFDMVMPTRNKARRRVAIRGKDMSSPNSVRVMRYAEDVVLQLRRTGDYINLSLTFDETRQLAAILSEAGGAP